MNLCFKNNLQNFTGRHSRQFYYWFLAVEKQINLIIVSRVISILDREIEWSQMLLQSLIQENLILPILKWSVDPLKFGIIVGMEKTCLKLE